MKAFLLAIGLLSASGFMVAAAPPAWWSARGVYRIDPATGLQYAADDYLVVNQGQLKQFATAAFDEFEANLSGGAGAQITAQIKAWFVTDAAGNFVLTEGARTPQTTGIDDFAIVNQGQLKNIASFFYNRLVAAGRFVANPWLTNSAVADDYLGVNQGQLKNAFSFSTDQADADGDGVPDWYEAIIGTSSSTQVLTGQVHPVGWDSDGDGIDDGWEVRFGLNPLLASDAASLDPDGRTYAQEYASHTSPRDLTPQIVLIAPAGAVVVP